jgi:hypothetical protein
MSLDYSTGGVVAADRLVTNGVITSGSTFVLGHVWSKDFNFLVLGIAVLIETAMSGGTHTFKLQLSDSAGSFSSPTDLATITVSGLSAAAQAFARVADASSQVDGNTTRALRVVHTSSAAETTGIYSWKVFATNLHE